MKTIVLFLVVFLMSDLFAQEDTLLLQRERQLVDLLNDLRSAQSNTEKEAKNKLFKQYLYETIQVKNAFEYPFNGLTTVGTVISDDKKIRMFNWNVEQDDQSQKYYCYILRFDERKKEYLISELIDNSFMLPARPDDILEANNWYGALYYKIIPITKGNKQMYTLLGYDANTTMSNVKLIDVLSFTGNNPKLGSPIFKTKTETLKRVFFEHSEKAYMSLKYEVEYGRIIYDHLSPETPSMTGFYSYYVPDFSYDAFVYIKEKWVLHEDVIGVNKSGNGEGGKVTVMVQNPKTGLLEKKEIKEKWINPTDPNAVTGSVSHVAVTPEDVEAEKKKMPEDKALLRKSKNPKSLTYSIYTDKEIKKQKRRDSRTHK